MDPKEQEFMKRLRATFKVEADEHIRSMIARLIDLEQVQDAAQSKEIIEVIFRNAHSLKGAARSVNLGDIERVCHVLEDAFSAWKRGESKPAPHHFDALHTACDFLERALNHGDEDRTAIRAAASDTVRALTAAFEEPDESADLEPHPTETLLPPTAPPPTAPPPMTPPLKTASPSAEVRENSPHIEAGAMPDTIRLSAARMTALLLEVEELLGVKLAAQERSRTTTALFADVQRLRREHGVYLSAQGEALANLEHNMKRLAMAADRDQRKLATLVDALSLDLRRALMLPFGTILEVLPRLCRDLARSQGKEVELRMRGAELEIDRRILDEMRDPILHLARNCIDHGLEPAAERLQAGKPAKGSLTFSIVQQEGSRVELIVEDDGRGFDRERLRAAAVKAGSTEAQEAEDLDGDGALALAFRSGVSTSPIITDVSGRGLGLAIVQERVDRLGGTLLLSSEPGQYTQFRIVLPSTLHSYRGVLVRVADTDLLFPTTGVERVIRVAREAIQSIENRAMLRLSDATCALAGLADILGLAGPRNKPPADDHITCVVVRAGAQRMAFEVDEVLGEQEVLAKNAGPMLTGIRNIAGIAMLGSGATVPILKVTDLFTSAANGGAPGASHTPHPEDEDAPRQNVLVAEDSITARALLKSVLETAGFNVLVAVDGAEALALLRTETIHLVVSDVEMPRLNGFELTARIRADARLADLPVVLVTALESREDRERGVEAGANAYIVKSSFAQSNLLEVIGRLL